MSPASDPFATLLVSDFSWVRIGCVDAAGFDAADSDVRNGSAMRYLPLSLRYAVRECLFTPAIAVAQACFTAAVPFLVPVSSADRAATVPSLPSASTAIRAKSSRFFRFVHPHSVSNVVQ